MDLDVTDFGADGLIDIGTPAVDELAVELLGPTVGGAWPCPRDHGGPASVVVRGSRWWCPTCGEGGGPLDLVMAATGLGLGAARARIASAAAVAVALPRPVPGSVEVRPSSGSPCRPLPPVRLAVERRHGSAAVEVAVHDHAATVADLAVALGQGATASSLVIDGCVQPITTALVELGLRHGSTICRPGSPAAGAGARTLRAPRLALAVEGGLDAGATHPIAVGLSVLGRARGVDIRRHDADVAPQHCLVQTTADGTVTVGPLGPRRALAVDGVVVTHSAVLAVGGRLDVGSARMRLVPFAEQGERPRPRAGEWAVPFNRPPRPPAPDAAPALAVPRAADDHRRWVSGGTVALVVSLAGAVAVAVLFKQPMLLLLGGVAAIGTIVTRLQSRRRDRLDARATAQRLAGGLTRFRAGVVAQHADARGRHLAGHPSLAVLVRWAVRGESRLWERRPAHPDAFVAVIGAGRLPWSPSLVDAPDAPSPEAQAVIAEHDHLDDVPVPVALGPGRVVGIAGDPTAGRALARALVVQLACLHGPADLVIAAGAEHPSDEWDWIGWLPHAADPTGAGAPLVAIGEAEVERVVTVLTDGSGERVRCLVVDGGSLTTVRNAGARPLLAGRMGPATGIVIADRVEALPAVCTTIVEVDADGLARVHGPGERHDQRDVIVAGVSPSTAAAVARALAGLDDPELHANGADLPTEVSLIDLLGVAATDGKHVADAWRALGPDPAPRGPIAMTGDGPVVLDLTRDGPHGLIAGTTGSGKSELLRTIVVSLAMRSSPNVLTFVLIDYKGGSAFDGCATLPHVVGVVTDLDEHLAERALRSLEAEIRHRERALRAAGAVDLTAYRRMAGVETMPRLVVVIDEFASMATELPDFLASLVGIAQRGRSLGVHLLLATQRPAGAVNDNIRANTNLRLALRVQDAGDSLDVLHDAAAASIARGRPGRAFLRLGPDELVAVQTARVTGPARATAARAVEVRPLDRARWPASGAEGIDPAPAADGPTELDLLVAAAIDAARRLDLPPARRPWLDPLPREMSLADVPPGQVAVADDPDGQCRRAVDWDRAEGNLLLYGIGGSGTTSALAALALQAARACAPSALHLYVIDMGAGTLSPLAALPHCGAVVRADETERQRRLIRFLRGELDRRRGGGSHPDVVVLIDGYAALAAAYDDPAGFELLDDLERVVVDGPQVGMVVAASAERAGAIPTVLAAAVRHKWVFRLADRFDGTALGVASPLSPSAPPGRAVSADTGLEMQVVWPGPDLAASCGVAAAAWPSTGEGYPRPIGVLPAFVAAADLPAPSAPARPWRLPVGIGDRGLGTVTLPLHAGDHVLVSGPSRSGRSTTLLLLARQVRRARVDAFIGLVALRRSPLLGLPARSPFDIEIATHEALAALAATLPADHPVVLVVDDAELVDDATRVLADAVNGGLHPELHVIAAGRAEGLRAAYGHWTQLVRRSRLGVLLRPQIDFDGDLLGTVLPRRETVTPIPGRGYLVVDGVAELVQIARDDGAT